jgi:hypothetical protein
MIESTSKQVVSLNYATKFEQKLLGHKCDVEVVVNLASGQASVVAGMRQALRSSPACYLSLETLEGLAKCVRDVKKNSRLLDSLIDDATDHQLNCSFGGATLIVVKPPGKSARFTLTIGLFHREGAIEELSTKEIDDAVSLLEGLCKRVLARVRM